MKDVLAFAAAALPWVIMGICVIVLLVNRKKLSNADPDEEVEMDYGTEGMCLGMCFGTALGVLVPRLSGHRHEPGDAGGTGPRSGHQKEKLTHRIQPTDL